MAWSRPRSKPLRATVCKGNVSREEFAAFLLVAKEYRLNPLTKEIYAFPAKGGGIQPIVSIDGWCRIINEHPALDGIEFDDVLEGGNLIAVTVRIYRKDRQRPTSVTEYMSECRRATDVWKTWPARMLRHKALIQARYAFGFSGIVDPDEYERLTDVRRRRPACAPGWRRRTAARPKASTRHVARETGPGRDRQARRRWRGRGDHHRRRDRWTRPKLPRRPRQRPAGRRAQALAGGSRR